MKISNRKGLPAPFVSVLQKDEQFAPNEIRVTQLLKGVCETVLERRHGDEIERDAADMVWLLFGTAVHSILEQADEESNQLKEVRLREQVGDYVLTGRFDLYDESKKRITDYKTCSVWKVAKADFSDWRRQTLIYAWMLRRQGFEVESAEVIAFMKDHSKAKAKFDGSYPQFPVEKIVFHFKEKDFEEIEEFINTRIYMIAFRENMKEEDLPPCEDEERYHNPDKWAVMKNGRKSAVKVCASENAAKQMVHFGHGDSIEFRPGEDKKCAEYCAVAEFCPYWQARKGNA